MIQKLFPLDKNYILKEAQFASKQPLLLSLVETVRSFYLAFHNPLGIEDDTVFRIRTCDQFYVDTLENFYFELAGIYRYKFGCTQLELLFDGRSHFEKYEDDWREAFNEWVNEFCYYDNFLRAILEAAILFPENRKGALAGNRLKAFTTQYFELKVYKRKGIQKLKIA